MFCKTSLNNKNSINLIYKITPHINFCPKNDEVMVIFSFLLQRPSKTSEALKKGPNFGFLKLEYAKKNQALGRACMEKVSCIYQYCKTAKKIEKTSPVLKIGLNTLQPMYCSLWILLNILCSSKVRILFFNYFYLIKLWILRACIRNLNLRVQTFLGIQDLKIYILDCVLTILFLLKLRILDFI